MRSEDNSLAPNQDSTEVKMPTLPENSPLTVMDRKLLKEPRRVHLRVDGKAIQVSELLALNTLEINSRDN